MADKNRGGRSVGDDEPFDDETVDRAEAGELDDDAFDEDAFDDVEDGEGSDAPARSRSRSTVAAARSRTAVRGRDEQPGFFRNIPIFIREAVAELQKVIWPTRKELLTYTTVVVIFVSIIMTIVGLLDLGFARGLLWVFGSAE